MRLSSILLFLLSVVLSQPILAQNSSKSKSKVIVFEKGKQNKDVRVRNMNMMNSERMEFSPVYYKNGLVYVSSRAKQGPKDKNTGETYYDLYYSPFDPTGYPASPQRFSLTVNSQFHEGPVTFSHDFKTMFFSRSSTEKGVHVPDRRGVVRMKIYEASRQKNDWGNLRELPFNSVEYSCLHPSLSVDGQKLYFSSDMPGGQGGYDLWVSHRRNGGWSAPENLGADINTDKNEVFPFIHRSGTLFFSSTGHQSMGGLDIFSAKSNETGGYDIINLGEPFNSEQDDLGIIWDENLRTGFFASNRAGGLGKDDIYFFEKETAYSEKEEIPELSAKQLKIKILDKKENTPMQGVSVRIFKTTPEGFLPATVENGQSTDWYDLDLEPIDERVNAVRVNLVHKNADQLGRPYNYSNAAGETYYEFEPYRTYLVVAAQEGYRSESKLVWFEPKSIPEVIELKMEAPEDAIFSRGAVVSVADGKRVSDATCKFTHRANGRQTVVLTNLDGEFQTWLSGGAGEYLVSIVRGGYLPEEQIIEAQKNKVGRYEFRVKPISIDGNDPILPTGPVEDGKILVFDNLKMEAGAVNLTEYTVRSLEAIASMLKKYPEMEIDLLFHTDTQGDASTSLNISQERASNAQKYLIKKCDIAPARVRPIGKGKSEPMVQCGNGCSDEQNERNARIEVRIRKVGTKNISQTFEPK